MDEYAVKLFSKNTYGTASSKGTENRRKLAEVL